MAGVSYRSREGGRAGYERGLRERGQRYIPRQVETVVVGAGQAGLVMSTFLQAAGREHVLLERRETLGGGWQDRWDEFCLVTPNWVTDPAELPVRWARPRRVHAARPASSSASRAYAAAISAPVELGTDVRRLTSRDRGGFRVGDEPRRDRCRRGHRRGGRLPGAPDARRSRPGLPDRVVQVHSHHYRNDVRAAAGSRAGRGNGPVGRPARRGAAGGRPRGDPVGRAYGAHASPLPRTRHLRVARRDGCSRDAFRRSTRSPIRRSATAATPTSPATAAATTRISASFALDGIRLRRSPRGRRR